MKMKTIGILLAALSCGAAIRAETIGTAEAFAAKLAANPAGHYKLSADIDLTDAGYKPVATFTGILDGRGHKLTGLGASSLFLTNAGSVVSLTLDGRDSAGTATTYNVQIGGCFANISTGAFYADCRIVGYDLHASASLACVGLFTAYAYDGTHFIRCETDSSCTVTQNKSRANVQLGGIVGVAKRTDGVTTNVASFVDCTNRARIVRLNAQNNSFNYGAGGMVGTIAGISSKTAPYPEVNFVRCINLGDITTSADKGTMGGLVGLCNGGDNVTASTVRFLHCENRGNLTSSGKSVWTDCMGGILGAARGSFDGILIGCVNYGAVNASGLKGDGGIGGLVGVTGYTNLSKLSGRGIWRFENCANYGDMTLAASGRVGGICGYNTSNAGHNTGKFFYENCANYGTISLPDSVDFGAIVGDINVGNGDGTRAAFSNCWVVAGSPYTNCTAYVKVRENFFAADADGYAAADALASLNDLAAKDEGYLPWTMGEGEDAQPELSLFSGVAPADGIPVLFYDYDGTLLQVSTVEAGGSATPPAKPARDGWYFADWSGNYKNVTSTGVVFADYTRIKRNTGFRIIIR